MQDVVQRVQIVPNYAGGFLFSWEVSLALLDAAPWSFLVQEAPTDRGPWTSISPALVGQYMWAERHNRVINKDMVLWFRVQLTTPKDTYASVPIAPYGALGKREYLLVRDIMRRETLQAATLAGTLGTLWIRSTFGPKCYASLDPITGDVTKTDCDVCYGTGRNPGYHGPYHLWFTFSPAQKDEQMTEDGTGTRQPYSHTVRAIGSPYIKDSDVLVDQTSQKRYYVDAVAVETEIRRVPIVQVLTVHEVPVSDPIYRLGSVQNA